MPIDDPTAPEGSVPIPFAPGYRLCDGGVVWSCWSKKGTMDAPWHIRKPRRKRTRSGHIQIELQIDREPFVTGLHQLVMMVFVGPCPPGLECCHNDGNPENNFVVNLRYGTHGSNVVDRELHGKTARGEVCGASKLTEVEVRRVFEWYAQGMSHRAIAELIGVSSNNVGAILARQTWGHVEIDASLIPKGGPASGERHGHAKLNAEKVVRIFQLSHEGLSQPRIAKVIGVSPTNVGFVLRRVTWASVPIPPEFLPAPR